MGGSLRQVSKGREREGGGERGWGRGEGSGAVGRGLLKFFDS